MKTKFNDDLFEKKIENHFMKSLSGGLGNSGGTESGPTNHYPSGDTYTTIYDDNCDLWLYSVKPNC